ncbi:DsbA family oxidoreductase [Novosphingobium lentum]|uniref:DsbA family oxidoreductase n=1 Tax=Novosphingobium lentum TaxID=145287 RepID=UPI000B1E17FA|nr:DsbA family oxidoreductase [Novosphingobium lentum]
MSAAAAPTRVTIDIWSDVMCPWCLVGYRQLEKALVWLDGEIAAEIRWRPFELNPDMPPQGEDQAAHIMRKYGRTAEQAAQGRTQMREIAARAGAALSYAGEEGADAPPAMMWNTFAAHKLLAATLTAHGPDVQTALKLALFSAHFEHRRNVSDPAVLVAIAEDVGIPAAEAQAALADETLDVRVRAEEAHAWDMNISGVPAMVVNGKFLIPGAQEPEVYASTLRRVVERAGLKAEV